LKGKINELEPEPEPLTHDGRFEEIERLQSELWDTIRPGPKQYQKLRRIPKAIAILFNIVEQQQEIIRDLDDMTVEIWNSDFMKKEATRKLFAAVKRKTPEF
jgi:hypothetical protein